ncbi:hypothetical protein KIW84_024478 [Lathyrus oleraceus]|uniref:Coatomer subunit delta n=1 Tax=Pisum sativum TaxID=3888 RepID=A0A9D4YLN5_PEA|nr:hypothetical protein KIW84_024478 [Pisum sativum]
MVLNLEGFRTFALESLNVALGISRRKPRKNMGYGNETYVNIEYEASSMFDLQNVVVSVAFLSLREAPFVSQIDGEWSGSKEFVILQANSSAFYPISIYFAATETFSDQKNKGTSQSSCVDFQSGYRCDLVGGRGVLSAVKLKDDGGELWMERVGLRWRRKEEDEKVFGWIVEVKVYCDDGYGVSRGGRPRWSEV